jgi:hypothetical protein
MPATVLPLDEDAGVGGRKVMALGTVIWQERAVDRLTITTHQDTSCSPQDVSMVTTPVMHAAKDPAS